MSESDDKKARDLAFRAALAARKETFLAHYPRKLKIAVLFLLLVAPAGAWIALYEPEAIAWPQEAAAVTPAPDLQLHNLQPPPPAASPATAEEEPPMRQPVSDIEKAAVARNDASEEEKLDSAPDKGLVEESTGGYLPKIGSDGRKPWGVYARPFDRMDPRPRIAIIVSDLGLSRVATDAALRRLPADITLAFDAQADNVGAWLARARQDGHETLLSIPMEPLDFPRSDPGPNALLTSLPNVDNIERLRGFLKRGVGYVGVTTMTGSRMTTETEKILPILQEIQSRGLLVLDARLGAHSVIHDLARRIKLPVAVSSQEIDTDLTPQAIDQTLARLEKTARREGRAIAMASPLPVTLERLDEWAKGLASRGFVLAPVSAVVE